MGSRTESRRAALLDELCRRYGYCNDLDPEALTSAQSANEVIRAVLTAEGLDPVTCDRKTCALLEQVVDDWLFDPHGRGARSKLPR